MLSSAPRKDVSNNVLKESEGAESKTKTYQPEPLTLQALEKTWQPKIGQTGQGKKTDTF